MMNLFTTKRREFIIEEEDVVAVVTALNKSIRQYQYTIGNCGWGDEPSKWFIAFTSNDKKYGSAVKSLLEIGSINAHVCPGGKVDLYLTKNK